MASGKYEIPDEYQDEDRWWLFTKKQWLGIAIAAGLDLLAYRGFGALGLDFGGLVAAAILTMAIAILIFIKVPYRFYLYGSGSRLSAILYRLLIRRLKKNRVIYTGSYEEKREEK